jgi:hypothetical protein
MDQNDFLATGGVAALVTVPATTWYAAPQPTVMLIAQLRQEHLLQARFFHRFEITRELPRGI